MNQQDINNKLKSLEFNRFTVEELNSKLSQLFGTIVEIVKYEREECVKKELPHLDDQFLFNVNVKEINLSIDVDLFYIKDNANRLLITETNFEYV